jgi:hypothetical protein
VSLDKSDTPDVTEWAADLTYREVHLFVEGVFDGFRRVDPRFRKNLHGKVVGDSWYYKGGYVLAYALKVVLLAIAAVAGVGL